MLKLNCTIIEHFKNYTLKLKRNALYTSINYNRVNTKYSKNVVILNAKELVVVNLQDCTKEIKLILILSKELQIALKLKVSTILFSFAINIKK